MNIIRKPFKYRQFNATFIIIAVNAVFYLMTMRFPVLKAYLGLSVYGTIKFHYWWQLVTYMFIHGSFTHILFNMLGLFFFGTMVERFLGSGEFLLIYFLCGILDGAISLAVYFLTGQYYVNLIGASGALYSILLVYSVIFPRSVISIWGVIPVPAPILIIAYAVIEFVSQFFGSDNVAHLTHLTGFAIAWLYLVVRMGIHPVKEWKKAYGK